MGLGRIELSPYPTVSGHVTDAEGHPLWGVNVYLRRPGAEYVRYRASTYPDGRFQFTVEGADRLVVEFDDRDLGFGYEYFRDVEDPGLATPVTVGETTQLTGVDQHMQPDPSNTGSPTPTPTPTDPTPTVSVTPTPLTPPSSGATPGTGSESRVPVTMAARAVVRPAGRGTPQRVVLKVAVSDAYGQPVSGGALLVREHGTQHSFGAQVVDGRSRIVIPDPSIGRHRYSLRFAGTDLVLGARAPVLVWVPR